MPRAIPTTAIKAVPERTPFFNDGVLCIYADHDAQNKITGFEATYKGTTKSFPVKDRIKAAWMEMEEWCKKQD